MRVDKTCGFDSNGVCDMYTTCKEGEECDDWEASLISFLSTQLDALRNVEKNFVIVMGTS